MKMPKDLKYISATYEVHSDFDVEDVNWENVEDYYIKCDEMHIEYKDGTTETIYPHTDTFDLKWPEKEVLYNSNGEVTQ